MKLFQFAIIFTFELFQLRTDLRFVCVSSERFSIGACSHCVQTKISHVIYSIGIENFYTYFGLDRVFHIFTTSFFALLLSSLISYHHRSLFSSITELLERIPLMFVCLVAPLLFSELDTCSDPKIAVNETFPRDRKESTATKKTTTLTNNNNQPHSKKRTKNIIENSNGTNCIGSRATQ